MQLSLDQSESKPEVMSYPAAFALSATACGLEPEQALLGYAYAWLENQVAAAMKIVPLGQVAGQRLLLAIGAELPAHLARAAATSLEQIQTGAAAFAITCATHETQYSRIFRS
jgi:urease accessory protein